MCACLGVTCHLHFWQSDRGLFRATAVTWGWNSHRIRRVSTQSQLWRRKFPFRSQVRHSYQQAVPALKLDSCSQQREHPDMIRASNVLSETRQSHMVNRMSRHKTKVWVNQVLPETLQSHTQTSRHDFEIGQLLTAKGTSRQDLGQYAWSETWESRITYWTAIWG